MTYRDIKIFFGPSPRMCAIKLAHFIGDTWRVNHDTLTTRYFDSWDGLLRSARHTRDNYRGAATPNGLCVRTDILLPTSPDAKAIWGKCMLLKILFTGCSIGPTLFTMVRSSEPRGQYWSLYHNWKELADEFPVPTVPDIVRVYMPFFDGMPGYKAPDGRSVLTADAWESLL